MTNAPTSIRARESQSGTIIGTCRRRASPQSHPTNRKHALRPRPDMTWRFEVCSESSDTELRTANYDNSNYHNCLDSPMEPTVLAESHQLLEVIEALCRTSPPPCSPRIYDKASTVLQDPPEPHPERLEPLVVPVAVGTSICRFPHQGKRRTRDYEINRLRIRLLKDSPALPEYDLPEIRLEKKPTLHPSTKEFPRYPS